MGKEKKLNIIQTKKRFNKPKTWLEKNEATSKRKKRKRLELRKKFQFY